jgi:hypothetical protein
LDAEGAEVVVALFAAENAKRRESGRVLVTAGSSRFAQPESTLAKMVLALPTDCLVDFKPSPDTPPDVLALGDPFAESGVIARPGNRSIRIPPSELAAAINAVREGFAR